MVQAASTLTKATANAGNIERANQQRSAEQPEQSGFDVWTHTDNPIDRIADGRMYEGATPEMREALTDVSNWHRTSVDDYAEGVGQQWDKVGDDFMNMIGLGDPDKNPEGVLANVGAFFGVLTGLEQLLTSWVGMIPFPAMPALRVLDLAVGLPHGHAHPPTFGTPLPSIGPILPIPYVSGANTVQINGMPAARCGDMGIGAWCGGYVPIFEVFLGSSSVWLEGARAGRLLCDVTNHCIFSKRPGPKDPPVGPFIGSTIVASSNVAVGGFPLPSLTSMAMGAAFKALFKGLGKVFGALRKRLGRLAGHMDECIDGAPIMPVTGDMVDEYIDFELRSPVPFVWRRYYYSSWCETDGPHGYGYRHEYQRELRFTGRAWIYTDPELQQVEFTERDPGPEGVASDGMLLRRVRSDVLEIYEPGQPTMVFKFRPGEKVAPLKSLRQGSNVVDFQYEADGRLVSVDICGERLHPRYDRYGRIVELTLGEYAQGKRVAAYEYSAADCLIKWTDALGHSEQYEYDARRHMTVYTTRRGYRFLHEYDSQGRCVREWGEDGLYDVRMEYRPNEFKTIARYADGATKVYRYNTAGIITEMTDAEGGVTQWVMDDQGKVVEEIDPAGNVTQWLYNDLGGNVGRRDPLGYVHPPINVNPNPPNPLHRKLPETPLQWEFGSLVSVHSVATPAPDDPLLRDFPASVMNQVSEVLEFKAERGSREPAGVDRKDRGNGVLYDALGRTLEKEDDRGFRQSWRYDAAGNVIEHRDRDGSIHRKSYSSWRNLHQVVDPVGAKTNYDYTLREYPAKITDPGGAVSEYLYDLKDRIVEVRRHGRTKERYHYDQADNMIAKTDGDDRPLVSWDAGPAKLDSARHLASGETHRYKYDDSGRVASAETDHCKVECAHDYAGRRIVDLRDGLGVTHMFDEARLVATTLFEKFRIDYRREPNGDLTITDPTGGVHRISARSTGLISRTLANGTREICCYNTEGRCRRKYRVSGRDSFEVWSRKYSYSAEGDLLKAEDSRYGETHYYFDAAHRLCREIAPGGERVFYRDIANNLVEQPGLNDVRLQEGNRLAEANGDSFSYNDRNSICERRGRSGFIRYEYDSLDRLISCVNGEERWLAEYDALSRRVRKSSAEGKTEFYWDDTRLAAEFRDDGRLRLYVYVDHAALVPFMFLEYSGLDADPADGKPFYLFTNQIGTPVCVENETGQVVWSATIDPYGVAHIDPDSTIELSLRFPGHYYDRETNLHHNGHRYYSPELGRYLQSDPLGPAGGLNLYAYAPNPLTQVDLDGLATHPKTTQVPDPKGESPRPKTGAELAAERKLPELPEGYHWTRVGDEPIARANPKSGNPPIDRINGEWVERTEDAYRRQSFTAGERQQVYDNAAQAQGHADGKPRCPCGEPVESAASGDMDMGHKPEHGFAETRRQAIEQGTDPKDFAADQKNLDNYRPEHPSCNRSHKHE